MAIVESLPRTGGEDAAAIAELEEIVARQRAAFLADPFPSLEERRELLAALAGMLIANRARIEEAAQQRLRRASRVGADLIEVLGPAGRAAYAAEQLDGLDGAGAADTPTRCCSAPAARSYSPSPRA